ncbi:hypothetical protein [Paludibacterium purpuratum]|uniref:Type III secretion protein Q n=1 Tax=Paludibacterium purpuratum TaxID=1144873 RepID=A0A4R7B106_9NEIS|nr:hypothetical protein [Paludibacterium purpuratum]TDR76602.1 type III secretion protein Q [Paludibacterium purpuratum]
MALHDDPTLDLFLLSRIGASAFSDETRVTARRAQPSGSGVRIDAQCDGAALAFWVAEADWCAWLAPHWPVPALAALDKALWPLAAGITLTPLERLLTAAGLAPCQAARLTPAEAPTVRSWCLLCEDEARRLPLYVQTAPSDWLAGLLQMLRPDDSAMLTVPLGLGWCMASDGLALGDALPVLGAGDALDRFWLHPALAPGRIRLSSATAAQIDEPLAQPTGLVGAWSVEVAALRAATHQLWPWQPGAAVDVQVMTHPLARLVSAGRTQALGTLLRLTDGWAVRIERLRP